MVKQDARRSKKMKQEDVVGVHYVIQCLYRGVCYPVGTVGMEGLRGIRHD